LTNKLHFLWGYHPLYWQGLQKHGLVLPEDGLRIQHSPETLPERMFNHVIECDEYAKNLVFSERRPLLIDRGCGGIAYFTYPFDRQKMNAVAKALGDKFLGVQFHECYSNTVLDWNRVRTVIEKCGRFNAETLRAAEERTSEYLKMETGTPEEFAARKMPASRAQMHQAVVDYFNRKLKEFHGYLCAVEMYFYYFYEAARLGARAIMSESGGCSAFLSYQIGAVRGASRQSGVQWGVYYEPWRPEEPHSTCCYNLKDSLWNLQNTPLCGTGLKYGGAGGSSRSMQRRLWTFCYLAGAKYLSEEWGPENTFYDWEKFEITPYGDVCVEFDELRKKCERGVPVVPVALIEPADETGLDQAFLQDVPGGWTEECAEHILVNYAPEPWMYKAREFLRELFQPHPVEFSRREAAVQTPTEWGALFDVLREPLNEKHLNMYEMAVYLGEDLDAFRKRFKDVRTPILGINSIEKTRGRLKIYLEETLPVAVDGRCVWNLNRRPDGTFLLGLYNGEGVIRNPEIGERYDAACDKKIALRFKNPLKEFHMAAGWPKETAIAKTAEKHAVCQLPAGAFAVIAFR